MAAGMDAQDMEAKLVGDVDEAKAAWRAEEDPANKEGLWQMWKEAKDELNSFRRQQVVGGEDPKQGCREWPAWRAAAGGAPCGRWWPGPRHQGLCPSWSMKAQVRVCRGSLQGGSGANHKCRLLVHSALFSAMLLQSACYCVAQAEACLQCSCQQSIAARTNHA